MRLLNVTPFYAPISRGGERHTQRIAEILAAKGHEVQVLTTNVAAGPDRGPSPEIDSLPAAEIIKGVRVARISMSPDAILRPIRAWSRLPGGYRSLELVLGAGATAMLWQAPANLSIVRAVLKAKTDLVIAWNWYYSPAYQVHLARRLRRFCLVGVPLFHTEEEWSRRPVYDRMIESCDGIVTNTPHETQFIQSRVRQARQVVSIGAGIDLDRFADSQGERFRSRHGIGQEPVVGFVGSLSVQKGVDTILEAMPLVWQWNPQVRLILAGYIHKSLNLEERLQLLPRTLRERVILLPDFRESEKADLYGGLDVFVLPSTGESFGIAYLEAWACHKPVIGSRIGATSCVIEDGVDGMLARPRDPADLARVIREMLSHPERRRTMAQAGWSKTVARFTWERIAETFEQYCERLVSGRSTSGSVGAAMP